jgi:hypothetical protein
MSFLAGGWSACRTRWGVGYGLCPVLDGPETDPRLAKQAPPPARPNASPAAARSVTPLDGGLLLQSLDQVQRVVHDGRGRGRRLCGRRGSQGSARLDAGLIR